MALNIPNTDLPGTGFLKGVDTGSNLFSRLMNAKHNSMLHPSGDVANALYVEQLKNQYGENDPRYLEAKRAHDLVLSGRQSLMNYRDVLNQTAGLRATSPLGKLIAEGKGQGAQDILANQRPGQPSKAPQGARYQLGEQYYNQEGEPVYDNNPRTKEEKEAYERAIGKQTTDAAIRNKIPYAENVKITMDSIDPKALTMYSGIPGQLKLAWETLQSNRGNPSPEYLKYQEAVTSADTLKKQLRQFWGDSIQPSATEQIGKLTNPSHWLKNPQVAIQQFNQLKKITDLELESFKKHGTSPVKLNYDEKAGKFVTENAKGNKSALQQKVEGTAKAPVQNEHDDAADDLLIEGYLPKLLEINPKYTAENIKDTRDETGLSIAEIIDQLLPPGSKV